MRSLLSPKLKQTLLGIFVGILVIGVIVGIVFGIIAWTSAPPTLITESPSKEESVGVQQEEEQPCTENPAAISRTDTLDYVLDNINRIAPKSPKKGKRWTTQRVEFVDDTHVYADYTDGESNRRVLLETHIPCVKIAHTLFAAFQPEGDRWATVEGDDTFHETKEEDKAILEFYQPQKEWLTLDHIAQLEEERKKKEEEERLRLESERIDENSELQD